MKIKFLTFIIFSVSLFSFSQQREKGTIIRTDPNGVVVYKPIDVEYTKGIKLEKSHDSIKAQTDISVKTIDDYTLEELEYMLPQVKLKIEKYEEEEDSPAEIERAKEYKRLIEERIEKLKVE